MVLLDANLKDSPDVNLCAGPSGRVSDLVPRLNLRLVPHPPLAEFVPLDLKCSERFFVCHSLGALKDTSNDTCEWQWVCRDTGSVFPGRLGCGVQWHRGVV